jgi:hypothetical protein
VPNTLPQQTTRIKRIQWTKTQIVFYTGPYESNLLLHRLINKAFDKQTNIGWGHFLRGRLSIHWKRCIAEYYKHRQLGESYNLTLWMTKTIDAIWDYVLTIRTTRNGKLYGKDYDEQ